MNLEKCKHCKFFAASGYSAFCMHDYFKFFETPSSDDEETNNDNQAI